MKEFLKVYALPILVVLFIVTALFVLVSYVIMAGYEKYLVVSLLVLIAFCAVCLTVMKAKE